MFAVAADPLGSGLVASLARPGGNITGLSVQFTDTTGKRLELLREIVPTLRRLAIMGNVSYPAAMLELSDVRAAAQKVGIDVATLEIRRAEDITLAFEALKGRAEAVLWYLPPLGHSGEVLMAFFRGTKYPKTHVRPAQRESAVFEL